jgi:hypothetical protein
MSDKALQRPQPVIQRLGGTAFDQVCRIVTPGIDDHGEEKELPPSARR